MKSSTRIAITLATLFVSISVFAQTQAPPQASAPPQGTVSRSQPPAQSVSMAVELSKSVDSKKAKVGDPVQAKTMQDMKAPNGTDIPRGSRVIGHVTQASAHTKEQPQAQLGLVFEKIVTKSGQEFPFHGVLQAVSVPENAPPNSGGGVGPGSVGAQQQGGPGQQPGMAGPAGSRAGGNSETPGATAAAGHQGQGSADGAGTMGQAPTSAPATSGVTGLKDVQFAPGPEPALSSNSRNIHLDDGTVITVNVVPTPVGQQAP